MMENPIPQSLIISTIIFILSIVFILVFLVKNKKDKK